MGIESKEALERVLAGESLRDVVSEIELDEEIELPFEVTDDEDADEMTDEEFSQYMTALGHEDEDISDEDYQAILDELETTDEEAEAELDAFFSEKTKMVIRDGKKKRVKVRVGKAKRMSSKQKAALKKAQKAAQKPEAKKKREKSAKKSRKL